MGQLTTTTKVLIGAIATSSIAVAIYSNQSILRETLSRAHFGDSKAASGPSGSPPPGTRPVIVAINQWPGGMPLVVGAGGLTTQPGSAAAAEGLDLRIEFIEDAPSKNKALIEGKVDAVWQTVDELPMALGTFKAAGADVRTFLQIDWSRGGDACIASREVSTVEDLLGKKAAMLGLSPDHTLFEFMLTNSRLGPEQILQVRRDTNLSADDPNQARILFGEGKVDVACLWEPDVTLALASRPGSHRLFSTADATELVADILVAKREFLDLYSDLAVKLVRVWLAGVKKTNEDRSSAARLVSTVCSRFRDELGFEKTRQAFDWVKFSDLTDNVRMFGLDGLPPAFDRVYDQAESIWREYPQAAIKERFIPAAQRDDRIIRRLWEASGRRVATRTEKFQSTVAATGAPLFTKPVSINFRSNSSELTIETMTAVNRRVLPQLHIAGGMYIRVEGNTDAIGVAVANQQLSEKRAQAIVAYLISKGVDPKRIVARGNGSAKPIASNGTPEGRSRNRRTDILFIPSAAS
jgi:outer membrane protein OmpA-like peptidoglycan-associated protein/ABC-type nitrate/sulfonate/bicarbonate transport system substrate-binding protein